MKNKDDSISASESLFRYLEKKKVSDNVKDKIVNEISKEYSEVLGFSSIDNAYENPFDYMDSKRKKQ